MRIVIIVTSEGHEGLYRCCVIKLTTAYEVGSISPIFHGGGVGRQQGLRKLKHFNQ